MNFVGQNIFGHLISGDSRSVKAKKNIFASFFIKAFDALITFMLVPLTLGYLNPYEYGIWITMSSILVWIDSFDIGLGSGLRNKLGTAIAKNDYEEGRYYVSTTLFMLIALALSIFGIFVLINNFIDWNLLLNIADGTVNNIKEIVLVSFLFFCINFVLKFIGNVYQAMQLPAINNIITLSGHLVSLVVIFILIRVVPGSLMGVAMAYSAALPVVYFICYPITFGKLYPKLAPSFKFFRTDFLKELLSLSMSFFVLQIMGLVLFSFSNLIISNMFGPDQVTPYGICNRYFSIVTSIFGLLLAPIWSATTDAYAKKDFDWINNSLHKIHRILMLVTVIAVLMLVFSVPVYHLWIGSDVEIPFTMSLLVACFTMINLLSLSYSSFLFGMGILRIQMITIIIAAALFYPLCRVLAGFVGVNGIVLGMCLINIPGAIVNNIQLHKVISGQAKGIWLK